MWPVNQPTIKIVALCQKRLNIPAVKKMFTLKYEHSKVKVKGKVAPINVMKAYRGSRGIVPNVGVWLKSYPSCFTPGKEPWYPLNRRLRRDQSQSG